MIGVGLRYRCTLWTSSSSQCTSHWPLYPSALGAKWKCRIATGYASVYSHLGARVGTQRPSSRHTWRACTAPRVCPSSPVWLPATPPHTPETAPSVTPTLMPVWATATRQTVCKAAGWWDKGGTELRRTWTLQMTSPVALPAPPPPQQKTPPTPCWAREGLTQTRHMGGASTPPPHSPTRNGHPRQSLWWRTLYTHMSPGDSPSKSL